MILECPSCHARYVVPVGLFAQGGRTVRCARCKHEWQAMPPLTIDVFAPSVEKTISEEALETTSKPSAPTPNLPAVIKKFRWKKKTILASFAAAGVCLLLISIVLSRDALIKAMPALRSFYAGIGLSVPPAGQGLIFDKVASELRYDSGAMKLFVDGVIHNTTNDTQFIPDIRAQARAPDQTVIQSWWVSAPAATIPANGDLPFHTEIGASTDHTIEDVYLEFTPRDENHNVGQ